jgi:hypothetical protein
MQNVKMKRIAKITNHSLLFLWKRNSYFAQDDANEKVPDYYFLVPWTHTLWGEGPV